MTGTAISDETTKRAATPRGIAGYRAARWVLVLAAISAATASGMAVPTVADAGDATQFVETWRLLGFVAFAGVFVLLAYRPRHYAGLWELAIGNKLALTAVAAIDGSAVVGAAPALIADGAVTIMLVIAYVLGRGWHAWPVAKRST